MVLVGFFCFLGNQLASATGERSFAKGMDNVAADRTNVEARAKHVAGAVGVLAHIAREKLGYRHPERCSERFDERDVGKAPAAFPFGDGSLVELVRLPLKLAGQGRW